MSQHDTRQKGKQKFKCSPHKDRKKEAKSKGDKKEIERQMEE